MKVLLTGASGLLGTWLLRTVPNGIDVTAVVHTSEINWPQVARSDLRDPREARRVIGQARPDLVVHAAYQRDFASIVDVTTNVAAAARTSDADMVMVSTDAVFSGDGTPRAETDKPDPVWDTDGGRQGPNGSFCTRTRTPQSSGCRFSSQSIPPTAWPNAS